jgi:hypothetical protein
MSDEITGAGCSERFEIAQNIDRFQQIRFPLAVLTMKQVDSGREFERRWGKIPE